jgi:hypothetical protein
VSGDQRWTGGIANREWQSGARPKPAVDVDALAEKVREYVADCRRLRRAPSEKGCLTVVYYQGDAQKQAVLAAFREAVAHG